MRRIRECHEELFEDEIAQRVIEAFHVLHDAIGFGLPARIYRRGLEIELAARGLHFEAAASAEFRYAGAVVGSYSTDLLVESRIALTVVAGEALSEDDERPLRTYLRASGVELGLLLHFGLAPTFRRIVAPPLRDPRGAPRGRRGDTFHARSSAVARSAISSGEGTTASRSTG